MDKEDLRALVLESLRRQGFSFQDGKMCPPLGLSKDELRILHGEATRHNIERRRDGLIRHEQTLLNCLATGEELIPEGISPYLVEVQPESVDELLFRYASIHWSIPVSSGYGRRLRFLVKDAQNDKLIGLFGLGDPVFSLAGRDAWVGWNKEERRDTLRYVMDAFVLGAVPPYSMLLCGKLVASLVTTNEVRKAFSRKYEKQQSVITGRPASGELAVITTASALGRSSIYNRIKYKGRLLFQSVGFTRGSGEFHFTNGLYSSISEYAKENCIPTAKHSSWGKGFRSRREVIRKALISLDVSPDWLYHGVQRELFVIPLAANAREFLRREHEVLEPFDQPVNGLSEWFKERWLLPRSRWNQRYRGWVPDHWRLWPKVEHNG